MRIIAGTHKGRRLSTPRWAGLRPTSDRLRGTLFDILGPRVEGARVLDGCAGTGAVGLEALSRGAAHVVFVDQDPRAVALIRRNAAACGLAERCTVRRAALPAGLRRLGAGKFDLILLDPPYDAPDIGAMLAASAARLGPEGRLVIEHARRVELPAAPSVEVLRSVRAGDSALRFYRLAGRGGTAGRTGSVDRAAGPGTAPGQGTPVPDGA